MNYIAYSEVEGFVGFHGHPLNGTKFFTWGQSGPGRFMQDFLGGLSGVEPAAEGRVGDYAELQVGPAFTQMQTFDLPANATLEWTEFFGAFVPDADAGDTDALQSEDYGEAVGVVEDWLTGGDGVNDTTFLATDAWLASIADTPISPASSSNSSSSILAYGSPWGAVEEMRREAAAQGFPGWQRPPQKQRKETGEDGAAGERRNDAWWREQERRAVKGKPRYSSRQPPASSEGEDKDGDASSSWQLAPGLYFDRDAAADDDEAKAWVELITAGTFSDDTLAQAAPLSYQIGDEWLELLLASEASFGGSWLHDLHIGVALTERGDVDEPRRRFQQSLSKKVGERAVARIHIFLSFLSVVLRRNRE